MNPKRLIPALIEDEVDQCEVILKALGSAINLEICMGELKSSTYLSSEQVNQTKELSSPSGVFYEMVSLRLLARKNR